MIIHDQRIAKCTIKPDYLWLMNPSLITYYWEAKVVLSRPKLPASGRISESENQELIYTKIKVKKCCIKGKKQDLKMFFNNV